MCGSESALLMPPETGKETHPESCIRARGQDTLSLNPELEENLQALKPGLKEHTKPLESEPTKEIHPGPHIRVKKVERT